LYNYIHKSYQKRWTSTYR